MTRASNVCTCEYTDFANIMAFIIKKILLNFLFLLLLMLISPQLYTPPLRPTPHLILTLLTSSPSLALVPRAELEGDMTDQQMGLQARLMSKALRKITGEINNNHDNDNNHRKIASKMNSNNDDSNHDGREILYAVIHMFCFHFSFYFIFIYFSLFLFLRIIITITNNSDIYKSIKIKNRCYVWQS